MNSGRRLEALRDAMRETTLTATQRYVVVCLAKYADHKTGRNARPTIRTLADDAAVHTETVIAALDAAERAGVITATARAHRRPTVWTVLPDAPVRPTRTAVSGSDGQPCAASVRHLSGSPDSTTETTSLHETSPRDESSVSHTPPTTGAGEHEHLTEQLIARTIAGTPTTADRRDLTAFARLAHREGLTADDVLHVARDPRPAALAKNAALVIADAKARRHEHEDMAAFSARANAAHAAAATSPPPEVPFA